MNADDLTSKERPGSAGVRLPRRASQARYLRVACLSAGGWNPYLDLLYDGLAAEGFEVDRSPALSIRWLAASRRRVGVLHVHWPEGLYRVAPTARAFRAASAAKLGLFAVRLRLARLLGYRIVWTIHQVYPHESHVPRLDRLAARLLVHEASLLLAHDEQTAERARSDVGASRVEIVPHGSYEGVYERGRSRDAVRAELGVDRDTAVLLCFGELRAYKSTDLLLEAFQRARLPDAALVVAGHPKDGKVTRALAEAAAMDARIRWREGYVPPDSVFELFNASDVAVITRTDGGTSGSLILALSLGKPVVAPDFPNYRELTLDGRTGWHFSPQGGVESLRETLEVAVAERESWQRRGAAAQSAAASLSWSASARKLACLLYELDRREA